MFEKTTQMFKGDLDKFCKSLSLLASQILQDKHVQKMKDLAIKINSLQPISMIDPSQLQPKEFPKETFHTSTAYRQLNIIC